MNLLAIDTSTDIASIALLVGSEMTCKEQSSVKTHAQSLLPLVDRLLIESGVSLNHLDGIIFGSGPGSFTGLRIACSLAKGLAYAKDLGLIPVGSLDAIAFKARKENPNNQIPVLAVLDARMNELYWSYYAPNRLLAEPQLNAAGDIALSTNQATLLAGVGIDLYWDKFTTQLQSQLSTQQTLYPNAAAMIELAEQAAISPISVAEAQPQYVRNQVIQGEKRG